MVHAQQQVPALEQADLPLLVHEQRRRVAGVGPAQGPATEGVVVLGLLHPGGEHGGQGADVQPGDGPVQGGQALRRGAAGGPGDAAQQVAQGAHGGRGLPVVPGDVADDQVGGAVRAEEGVVPVAADLRVGRGRQVPGDHVQVVGLGRGGEQGPLQRLRHPGHRPQRLPGGLGGGDPGEGLGGERGQGADELAVGRAPPAVGPLADGQRADHPGGRPQRHRAPGPDPRPTPELRRTREVALHGVQVGHEVRSPGHRGVDHRQRVVPGQPVDPGEGVLVQRGVDDGADRRAVVVGQAEDHPGRAQRGGGVPGDHGQRPGDGLGPAQRPGHPDQPGHPLGVGVLLVGRLARVGDVGVRADHPHRSAGVVAQHPPQCGHQADGAVGPHHPELGVQPAALVDGLLQRLADHRAVVGVDAAVDVPDQPGQGLVGQAEHGDAAVVPDEHVGAQVPVPQPCPGGLGGQRQPGPGDLALPGGHHHIRDHAVRKGLDRCSARRPVEVAGRRAAALSSGRAARAGGSCRWWSWAARRPPRRTGGTCRPPSAPWPRR
ncbi:unannotated protein [freshwater metagenome]|uniref:Unannotated protein n=1 Tax=freshwater metagenome TaxID=449393 RepID=A0A6J7IQJ3_9ZZZZ